MGRLKLNIACEEQLQIEKLIEEEQAARRGSEFDVLYVDAKNNAEAAKAAEEETPEDTPPEGEGQDGQTPPEDNAEGDITQSDPALEEFRELTYAQEDIATLFHSTKEIVMLMGSLGIQYGTEAAKHIYKGVVYIFAKMARLLYVGGYNFARYVDRSINSFENIKASIADARKALDAIEVKEDQSESSEAGYTQQKVINTLKIGNSVEFSANIETLSRFVENTVKRISQEISHESNAIKHIVDMGLGGNAEPPVKLMRIQLPTTGFSEGVVEGYQSSSEYVDSFHSAEVLPSDVVLIATLPKPGLVELKDIAKAYSDSSMILGINSASFQQVDSVDYMTPDALKGFLDKLDQLCDVCIAHKSMYDKIKNNRSTMKMTLKSYFLGLTHKKHKVSLQNSFVEYVYLKTMFVDKVYLTSVMDIHDYTAKVLTTGLRYVKDHVSRWA